MLDAGDEQQALQLAESNPPLLDLLTRLSFAESHSWRIYCQTHGLPIPETIDTGLLRVSILSMPLALRSSTRFTVITVRKSCGIVLKRRPPPCVPSSGSTLAMLTPREELVRVENKRLDTRLQDLAKALSAGDKRSAALLVDSIEDQAATAGLNPLGSIWENGLAARREQFQQEASAECNALLPPLDALRTAGKWQAAIPMNGRAHRGLARPFSQPVLGRER